MLLAIELADELVGGTLAAAWPLLRRDLHLDYTEIGLALAVPGLVGSALDPLVGAAGDTSRRRVVLLAGGVAFALSTALLAAATGFWTLLVALVAFNPASGAFVGLAQAVLMDGDPGARERNMARWTLAGSFGYVGGPVLVTGAVWVGLGWRGAFAALALLAGAVLLLAARVPAHAPEHGSSTWGSLRVALAALRRGEVVRWLVVLECIDLLLDVFHAFLALYLVDVAGVRPAVAALGVGLWTGAGLAGDWLVLLALRRVGGGVYLRGTACVALVAYPAFLLVPGVAPKLALAAALGLLSSGWYAIPKARLYDTLDGRSGVAVAVGGVAGLAGSTVPLLLGVVAGAVGLAATMWLLLLAPLALLALVPLRRDRGGTPISCPR